MEKVKDEPVYLIFSRESLRQEEVDPIVGKAHVDTETSYPDIRRSLEDGFRFHMETAITRDLSIVVTKYLASCMGIPVRPKNGEIYFVLEKYGSTLLLINDHDPKPLYYQFAAGRTGEFDWNYVEQGPEAWKVEIHKKGTSHQLCHSTKEHEHHHFDKTREVLRHEHRVIERVLAAVQKLTEPSRRSQSSSGGKRSSSFAGSPISATI